MCIETYRGYKIYQNFKCVTRRNPVSGHVWREPVELKSMHVEGPGVRIRHNFFSLVKAREHIDYIIFVNNFIKEREAAAA